MTPPRNSTRIAMTLSLIMAIGIANLMTTGSGIADEPEDRQVSSTDARERENISTSVAEAQRRARLLHETIHGVLQVVHRDFFDEDDAFAIPSQSLEDVFHELARSQQVRLRWLRVDTDVVNTDHEPRDDYERKAVANLASGTEYESIDEETYRFAGPIRLASQCLKCHVKLRSSTRDRTAGLMITMPLQRSPRDNQPNQP